MIGRPRRSRARAGWLVLLAVLVLGPLAVRFATRTGDAVPLPRSAVDHAYVVVDTTRWILADRDGDGRVDCLSPVGWRGVVGTATLRAATGDPDCRGVDRLAGTMSDDLRDALDELLQVKYGLDAAHGTAIDEDGDGRADCVVSVHAPDAVALLRSPGSCATLDATRARVVEAVRVGDLDRMLRHETEVRAFLSREDPARSRGPKE